MDIENEIEVGEYVRTKSGYIMKYEYADFEKLKFGEKRRCYEFDDIEDMKEFIPKLKHSKNIIDLIEVGDFVNGYKVLEVEKLIKDIEAFKTIYNKDKIAICIYKNIEQAIYKEINNDEIKTILTHEQYDQNCYEMEENKIKKLQDIA